MGTKINSWYLSNGLAWASWRSSETSSWSADFLKTHKEPGGFLSCIDWEQWEEEQWGGCFSDVLVLQKVTPNRMKDTNAPTEALQKDSPGSRRADDLSVLAEQRMRKGCWMMRSSVNTLWGNFIKPEDLWTDRKPANLPDICFIFSTLSHLFKF